MISGIINLLKPPGMTSHDAVAFVRRIYGQKQVGHAGTLDPAAAGVLPVFLGRATRLVEYSTDADKSYRVELTFGYETDTGDDTGRIIRTDSAVRLDSEELPQVLQSFVGASEQIPPMYSAIKVGGKKLYDLARQGVTVERSKRSIVISEVTLLERKENVILFDVTCSKGTYIRSLCADIGARLGCPAVMSFLIRTRVGTFSLAAAKSLEEIAQCPAEAVLAPEKAIEHFPAIVLSEPETARFLNGQKMIHNLGDVQLVKVYDYRHCFVGIGSVNSSLLIPMKVFPPES